MASLRTHTVSGVWNRLRCIISLCCSSRATSQRSGTSDYAYVDFELTTAEQDEGDSTPSQLAGGLGVASGVCSILIGIFPRLVRRAVQRACRLRTVLVISLAMFGGQPTRR